MQMMQPRVSKKGKAYRSSTPNKDNGYTCKRQKVEEGERAVKERSRSCQDDMKMDQMMIIHAT